MSSETEGAKGGREGMEGKKKRKESENTTKEHDSIDSDSPVIQTFLSFRTEMDSHHDKYERLVKISRDITIASKRIIFNLHRAVGSPDMESVFKECITKFSSLSPLISSIEQEISQLDPHRYSRAFSNGYQELVEALTFYHFLRFNSLVSFQHLAPFFKGTLLIMDYVLGVLDLTGEMMRACISAITAGDRELPLQVCSFMKEMNSHLQQFRHFSPKELSSKLRTLSSSLLKVEKACYSLHLRGSSLALTAFDEDPDRRSPDLFEFKRDD